MDDTNKKNRERLYAKAMSLPLSPGVYIMHDKSGKIIYIGKSKALKNRVSQYFAASSKHHIKTENMVSKVADFDYIITDTEIEALALENRLIKLHKPKYNIKLKDCKNYPYIKVCVTDEYPKIVVTRKRDSDKAKYFGPYSGMDAAYSILRTVQTSFGIPSCNRVFPRDIGKERPCIYRQMGRCLAPCAGDVTQEEYKYIVSDALSFLRGSFSEVRRSLEKKMIDASENLMFEAAAVYRDRLRALGNLWEKQKVVGAPDLKNDIFGLWTGEMSSCLTFFCVRDGCVIDSENFIFSANQILDNESILSFIADFYVGREYIPHEILLGFELGHEEIDTLALYLSEKTEKNIVVRCPERGDMRRLCELVNENSRIAAERADTETEKDNEILWRLADMLKLEVIPQRIEAYDVSNMGNDNITAGKVTAVDCRFVKRAYRSYTIKNCNGQDDYSAMCEAIGRRLKHVDGPDEELPDLILLDGGKGHVSVVRSLLQAEGYNIPVFGMVKDKYHKTRALSTDTEDISIAHDRAVFAFIYRLQEEVHRYTVGRMTAAKTKSVKRSSLEKIKGIGPSKAAALLSHFGSLKRLKEATAEQIAAVKGISAVDAENVVSFFR